VLAYAEGVQMLKAYINYPNPHISVHGDPTCSEIRKQQKSSQREVRIDVNTISNELEKFVAEDFRFGASAALNDMWLAIDFGDPQFELAVVKYIQREVGKHYKPLAGAKLETHC
jgi:hypothetical protein